MDAFLAQQVASFKMYSRGYTQKLQITTYLFIATYSAVWIMELTQSATRYACIVIRMSH